MGRVENRLSPALLHQTVHAVLRITAYGDSPANPVSQEISVPGRHADNFFPSSIPDCKIQEVEAFLPGINNAGLCLVKRGSKSTQHMPYRDQGLIYFARAQHNKIIRITDERQGKASAAIKSSHGW